MSQTFLGRPRVGTLLLVLLSGLLPFVLLSCSKAGTAPSGTETSDAETLASASLAIDSLGDGWSRIEPGEGTVCSDGSDYSFFVRPGDRSKLLFYLEGGGGCWNGNTCSSDRFGTFKPVVGDSDPASTAGIFDLGNNENPFSEHSIVYVPYCTGDIHLGDLETTYDVAALEDPSQVKEGGNPGAHQVTIQHRGHDNVTAVLDWISGNFIAPTEIFVTGSSAGSIPSPYYAAHIQNRYRDARVAQLGDGSSGYRKEAGWPPPYKEWGVLDNIDADPAFGSLDAESYEYEALYIAAAQAYPSIRFASFDAAEDATQLQFLRVGGATADSLQPLLDANQDEIKSATDNYRSYVSGGNLHVILTSPDFYTYATNGVRLSDWVAALAAGEPVEHVHCLDCSAAETVSAATAAN